MQTSESFKLSALLSLSGGLQDAYTYNLRGGVFANAQTGNVVLMSQNFLMGQWRAGIKFVFPLLSFIAGVFVAEQIEHHFKNSQKIHWRQIILAVEILMLVAVGFLPESLNMLANVLVSFACAMQVQTFKKVHGYGYASTMCIGNLRSGTESLSQFVRTKDREALKKALHFFSIILFFALGAGIGGVLCGVLGMATIWISPALLLLAALLMVWENDPKLHKKQTKSNA